MSTTTVQVAEEFLSNLRSMATGDYLNESDREFWEPPYPESAVDDARTLITDLLNAAAATASLGDAEIDALADDVRPELFADPDGSRAENSAPEMANSGESEAAESGDITVSPRTRALAASITPVLDRFVGLSDKHFGALLDVEEIDDLVVVIHTLATDVSADPDLLGIYVRNFLTNRLDGAL